MLPRWIAAAEAGLIPRRGVTVVHFDAHPDLALPGGPVPRAWPPHPESLLASVDIASFQLAAARIGLVSHVVWLRPDFARQIPDGRRRFAIGENAAGELRVDDPADYYVLDEAFAPRSELRDWVELELTVVSLAAAPSLLDLEALRGRAVVLDVDLDGFATRNPAAEALRRAGVSQADLDLLRRIFDPERLPLPEDPAERVDWVAALLRALERAGSPGLVDPLVAGFQLWWLGIPLADLTDLASLLYRADPAVLEVLLERGRDLVGLPEHRPDPAEIHATAEALAGLAAALQPRLVTIARSVDDGFTHARLWPEIERSLLDALERRLGTLEIRFDRGLGPVPGRR